jgi:hypothetical protein
MNEWVRKNNSFYKDKKVATIGGPICGLIYFCADGGQEVRVSLPEAAIFNKNLGRYLCVSQSLCVG